ncbi:MAG: UDP-N-acetylmuramate dehydrogenase [Ignavibacteriae bacterium]|nr:UDP-N-acetylmuramate dehydrogenase [Ignavibacteriota bacterium]
MTIHENSSLKEYNTFGIEASARYFVDINSIHQLPEILEGTNIDELLILGGGSNLLFTRDWGGTVLKISIMGKEIIDETNESIILKIGAGENWHKTVEWCVKNNYAGIENLALIPGTAGAAPIQNIGAYGVEVKDVFESLEAFDILNLHSKTFHKDECEFGYRDSVFKKRAKGHFVITSVTLRLRKSKEAHHTSYNELRLELDNSEIPTINEVFTAVCAIRTRKLPDPLEIGNAGSFFKNPIISSNDYKTLHSTYHEMPSYPHPDGMVKIPAAWLIEQCGWKGVRHGEAGVYPRQALVIVNYGGASGEEIMSLAREIQDSVHTKFGITIEQEVNVI